jgi:hypothetical protein
MQVARHWMKSARTHVGADQSDPKSWPAWGGMERPDSSGSTRLQLLEKQDVIRKFAPS